MKIIHILMVIAFLFATTTTNVAQAAGPRIGYLRLLSAVSPGMPIQMQARHAFDRMRPRLLALQKQGVILEFEPELQAGIVKVQYATGRADMSPLGGDQIYDNIHDAIITAPQKDARSQSVSGAIAPTFYPELYSSCFGAANLGAFSHVVGSLRDKANRVVATYEGDADTNGEIYLDCFPWSGPYATITPGFTLTFKVYDSTPALLGTFSVVTPAITFAGINRLNATVGGTGPAGKVYQVGYIHENWNAGHTLDMGLQTGTITPAGLWGKDMSSLPFRGGDELDIFVKQNSSFEFSWLMYVPYIYCQLGGNYCDISGFPFRPATLIMAHSKVGHIFTGKFDSSGYFSAYLENAGDPIFMVAGDQVGGTGVPLYTLPSLTTMVYFSTDVVFGKVPANRYFELWAYTLCSCTSYEIYSHSDAMGNYSADFTSQVDLVSTQATNLEVYYVDLMTGNTTDFFRSFGP